MTLFVDTSVWSLAFRRDKVTENPVVATLQQALESGQPIATTGLVLQELLQGFSGPKAAEAITERFRSIPMIVPTRQDNVDAANLRNRCRRSGVQVGTIDALLAQICIRNELTLLSTDGDFVHIKKVAAGLKLFAAD